MKELLIIFSISCSVLYGFGTGITVGKTFQNENPDTTFISYPDDLKFAIPRNHQYHQTLTMKICVARSLWDGKFKRRGNGKTQLFLSYDQALDLIRRINNLTLGIPKIIYIVGWESTGDSWFEGNAKLKRPGDTSSLASLKWLMHEAIKYHTTVSLHINMFDTYEDSPLWNTYVKNNIIARNTDGTLRTAEWGYPISYAQEWRTGFTKKRIDSLCNLLPLKESGTIHIDAFHSWPPIPVPDGTGKYRIDLTKGLISPYLNFTVKDETEAQRNIFRYWASKGIDVTSEGADFLRETAFEGYQPMAWWYGGLDHYLKWPASYYCGGQDNSELGKLFGTSMHGEDIIQEDFKMLPGFREQFCLKTVIWYYLNRLDRLYLLKGKDYKAVQYSDKVRTSLSGNEYKVTQGNTILVENEDVLIPALWINDRSLIAYSKAGYENKTWVLPEDWSKVVRVKLTRISAERKTILGLKKTESGKLTLTIGRDEMLLIERK